MLALSASEAGPAWPATEMACGAHGSSEASGSRGAPSAHSLAGPSSLSSIEERMPRARGRYSCAWTPPA
eukprot:scaffold13166_cov34-Prasinocladus_malaysianus.AAC.1